MKEKTDKILTLALLGLAIVSTVFAFIFALDVNKNSGMFDIAYWLMIIMLAASIVGILLFLVKKLAQRFKEDPGYLKKFLMLIGIIVVLAVVSYLPAKADDVDLVKYGITEGTSKLIGACCILCYILCGAAAIAILACGFIKPKQKKNN